MAETAERADSYLRHEAARVTAGCPLGVAPGPPPTADARRAEFYSRAAAHWQERARQEARRADHWRGRACMACGAALWLAGVYRGPDWLMALGVVVIAATVILNSGRVGR